MNVGMEIDGRITQVPISSSLFGSVFHFPVSESRACSDDCVMLKLTVSNAPNVKVV